MTIDELLAFAVGMMKRSEIEIGRDRGSLEKAAQYAAVAQAAAATARAMMLDELRKSGDPRY